MLISVRQASVNRTRKKPVPSPLPNSLNVEAFGVFLEKLVCTCSWSTLMGRCIRTFMLSWSYLLVSKGRSVLQLDIPFPSTLCCKSGSGTTRQRRLSVSSLWGLVSVKFLVSVWFWWIFAGLLYLVWLVAGWLAGPGDVVSSTLCLGRRGHGVWGEITYHLHSIWRYCWFWLVS